MKRGTVKKVLAVMLSVGTITGNFAWSGSNVWAAEQTEGQEEQQPGDGNEEGMQPGDGNEEEQEESSDAQGTQEPEQQGEEEQQKDPETSESEDQNPGNTPGTSTEIGGSSLIENQILQVPGEEEEEQQEEQQQEQGDNTEDENTETDQEAEGEDVLANSWRFKDGVPIPEITARAATYPYAWEMVDGHYVNSRGEVIPGAIKKGIDVSFWNGTIDWEKVKADGIDFAIIRCGYGMDQTDQDDTQWARNVAECERLGIPYGVYLYSYANSIAKASSEADHVLRLLQGHNPTYPVYYDLEDDMVFNVSASMKGQIAKTFCDKIEAAGYKVGIYSNTTWFNNYLTDPVFSNPNWSKWVAQWNVKCEYQGSYDLWQCTSTGSVDGISGNVDLNFLMEGASFDSGASQTPQEPEPTPEPTPEPEVPNRVMQYDEASGNWYVYTDGKRDTTYTGVVPNENGWWYAKNGVLDWSYTGVAQNEYGWWYINDGWLNWDYTGVAQNEYGWWYINHGAVDWSYTGVAQNEYGWWYINDGWLNWDYTGVAQNEYGWWYINHGAVDWSYTGVAQNEHGWWYINDGWLNWNYTGVGENEHGWWYINNGCLNWDYNGKVTYKGRTYSVVNGCVIH